MAGKHGAKLSPAFVPADASAKKLLFLVTEDWYFLTHRLELARKLHESGWIVEVACSTGAQANRIPREGFRLHPVSFRRHSLAPWAVIGSVLTLRRVVAQSRPDLVFPVALRPILLTPWCVPSSTPVIHLLAGMGSLFTGVAGRRFRGLSSVVSRGLRWSLRRPRAWTVVQNRDDRAEILNETGVGEDRVALIEGTGLDPAAWSPQPEPQTPRIRLIFVGRLLADKGIRELLGAHQILWRHGTELELEIVGEADPANPESLREEELGPFRRKPGLHWMGRRPDVLERISGAHIFILPSYREGLPRAILEAGLCARAVVATDVAGCREIIRHGENGLLVPRQNAEALAWAIGELVDQPEKRHRLGRCLREDIERRFSVAAVWPKFEKLVRQASGR